MQVLDPMATVTVASQDGNVGVDNAPRPTTLEGCRIGFVDNGWEALHELFGHIGEALADRYGTSRGAYIESHDIISDVELAELIESVDCVVVGLGN